MNHEWTIIDPNKPFSGKIQPKAKKPHIEAAKVLANIIAVIFSVVLIVLGIGWLSAVVTVLVSGKILGFTIFFGIPPLILSVLITAGMYVAYWPVSLLAKGFWSIAKGKNRYKNHEIITGAILFALSIAALVIIGVNLGRNINFEYKDNKTRVILDEGNICVSDEAYCVKY